MTNKDKFAEKNEKNRDYDYSYDTIERMFVGKSLIDKKYIAMYTEIYSEFSPDRWFTNKNASVIIMLASKYYKAYGEIPNSSTLKLLFKKICETRGELKQTDLESELLMIKTMNLSNDDSIERNILKFIREKGCYYSFSDTINNINKGDIDPFLRKFEKIDKISFSDDSLGMNYFSKEGQDSHWDYINNPEAKISTGWDGLDFYTNKGIPKDGRFLGLILAQSGLGKSLFLSNMSVNFLKQNLTVGVISLEMSENVYAQRFTAHISHDNVNRLRSTCTTTRGKIENFYRKYPKANLLIKEYPPRSISTNEIDSYLEKLKDKGIKLDVLVVDYLNLLIPTRKSDSMFQDGMVVSEELRSLSYKWEIPIMSAVQSNTEGMGNENIDMENVSQSRGIVFTADAIFALYQKDDDREQGQINMRIVKNRLGGMVGKILNFKMNSECLTVEDMTTKGSSVSNSESDAIINNLSNISSDMQDL